MMGGTFLKADRRFQHIGIRKHSYLIELICFLISIQRPLEAVIWSLEVESLLKLEFGLLKFPAP